MGMLPSPLMEGIARLMQGFMDWESPDAAVKWFSLTNLRGAAVSLTIGAAVYFLVVRTLLMRRDENGVKYYVNRLPARLDLEEIMYRPLIQRLLPFLGALVCRVLDNLTDWTVALLNITVLRRRPIPPRSDADFEPGEGL